MTTVAEHEFSAEEVARVSADAEPEFNVFLSSTDVDGVDYLEINARRSYTSMDELQRWLHACVTRIELEVDRAKGDGNV